VRPALAEAGFRAVSPWMRGYAPTEIPASGAYDVDTLGHDALGLIDALGFDEAIVVGHDWGATAAFSAAGLCPEKIRKLVTIAVPHPASLRPTPAMLWTVRHFFTLRRRNAASKIRQADFAYIDELVRRWSPAWNVPPNETDAVKRSLGQPGSLEAAIGYYKALSPRIPASQRRKVSVPAVAFAGTDDIIDPEAFRRATPRYAAGYEVVTMPGGHFMHREHPERFNRELLRVLTDEGATVPRSTPATTGE
jgi:pimeloyl-ACP methyl ester carboxylesterase